MRKIIILFLLVLVVKAPSKAQIINTFAGNGSLGYSGDGGPATSAELNNPNGLIVDTAGNVYISDNLGNVIRKVSPSGTISTFAGTGVAGYSGDGGAATSARIHNPVKITMDKNGNIYIPEYSSNVVRKVTPSGTISTIAGTGTAGYSGDGGPATSAELFLPSCVAIDTNGNLYIADYGNAVIRKISTSGTISTFAGTGIAGYSGDGGPALHAQFYQNYGIMFDKKGNMYVTDAGNHRIRIIYPSDTVETFAGTGIPGYSGDGGPADSAQLNNPAGIAIDGFGNIYITDQFNHVIRKVDTSGTISTFAGTGVFGYSGDGGPADSATLSNLNSIAIAPSGNAIYLCDNNNHVVRIITFCSNHLTSSPRNDTILLGTNATFSISDTGGLGTYQWQEDAGTGFTDLSGSSLYSGVTSKTLTITAPPISMSGYKYRCVRKPNTGGNTSESDSCMETSNAAVLVINPTAVNNVLAENGISIWPNPTNNYFTISSKDLKITSVALYDITGRELIDKHCNDQKVIINVYPFAKGIYFLKINNEFTEKILKD